MSGKQLRVVTYNILVGAVGRGDLVLDVLSRLDADVIALQEASDPDLVHRITKELKMKAVVGEASDGSGMNTALLSRLPFHTVRDHRHPGKMLRSHLDCEIELPNGPKVRVHCVHLAARFGEKSKGEVRRMRELTAVLGNVQSGPKHPHLLIGDFNAIAPGDNVAATTFFRRMADLRRARIVMRDSDGLLSVRRADDEAWASVGVDPRLDVGIPRLPGFVVPLTGYLPASKRLDALMGRMIERWTITKLKELDYIDCYRRRHPRANGFTCATWSPAARVDYIFASPDLAKNLVTCDVVGSDVWQDPDVTAASDHFPVVADFRTSEE